MELQSFKDEIKGLLSHDNYRMDIHNTNEVYLELGADEAAELCREINRYLKYPLVSMFASDERILNGGYAIYYILADSDDGFFLIIKTLVKPDNLTFPSIAPEVHAAAGYEREIYDLFGIKPVGHPLLKPLVFHNNWPENHFPLRRDYKTDYKPPFMKSSLDFNQVEGEGIYEIPVGPVHAGIIEPGHFRFSVAGEPIINLDAQLSYVHKGIEKLSQDTGIEKCFYISERISGDETFSNSLAYCQAIEKIAGVIIPPRACYTRVVFAELERLTSHLGDLAGICVDVAYGFAAFQFRMMRGWAYLVADELCGMRFLRSVNKPGGVRKDFISNKEQVLKDYLLKIKKELEDTEKIIKSNSMFIDRIENTGILKKNIAVDLHAVGPPARAAGIWYDVRKQFPYSHYEKLTLNLPQHKNGDVNCRMNVKLEECQQSIALMLEALDKMMPGPVFETVTDVPAYKYALGYTESPRGENIHWIMTGENNTIFRYKIRTPSFCNWPALCHAVNGNIVPDFPLINKSFNLSYAGNDL